MGSGTIRAAVAADDDALWAILEPIFRAGETYCVPRNTTRIDALAYWSGGTHDTYILEEDGEALGTYFICPNNTGGGAHVCNCGFATTKSASGRGVARQMLAHAQLVARAEGFLAMQFNFVIASNTRAVELWKRDGFEVVGSLPKAFDHPRLGLVDAYVMYKFL